MICSKIKHARNVNVFTEQGVAMLSSILNSDRAIEVNIAIMRAFVELRKISSSHKQLAQKLSEIEARLEDHDESIEAIFDAIRAVYPVRGHEICTIPTYYKARRIVDYIPAQRMI